MTKDELYNYIYTDNKGEQLSELITGTSVALQTQFISPYFDGSEEHYMACDFIFDMLVNLLAKASDYLQHKPAEVLVAGEDVYECPKCGYQSYKPEPSTPMRRFVKSEPLTMQQFAIADAVRVLSESNRKLAAIKLIRASFLDDNGGFCRLTEAKEIYDSIMARGK